MLFQARFGRVWLGAVGRGVVRHGLRDQRIGQRAAPSGGFLGEAWLGEAWHGGVGCGMLQTGPARQGVVRLGDARLGLAWRG